MVALTRRYLQPCFEAKETSEAGQDYLVEGMWSIYPNLICSLENKSQDLISVMLNAQSFKAKVKKFSKAATAKASSARSAAAAVPNTKPKSKVQNPVYI